MNEQYLQNIYNYIVAVDDSFEGKMTFDAFKEKMGSQQYAAKIYDFMGETDDTFKSKLGVVDFLDKVGTVKKKEPAQDTDSKSEDTSSESFTVDNTEYLFSIDPNNIQGRDTRQAGYVDPITLAQQQINKVIGTINAAEPGERQLQAAMTQREMNKPYYLNAVKQSEADKAFTEQQIANAQAGLDVMVANEEEQVIAANIDMANANRDIVNSETFKNDLANITEDKIALDEDEGADYFAKMLGKYGITVRKKGGGIKKFFGYVGGMAQEDIDKEFNGIEVSVVTPNGVKTEYIDLDTFTTAGGKKEAEKLRKFVRKYAQTPSEQRENVTQDVFSQNSIRAQELRKTPRINDDGTESTVLFESAVIDGKPVVYPTLFPKSQNVESNDPYFWMEKRGMDAYETALERGEVFSGFKDEDEANRFAEGAWKDVNNVDVEADRFYRERGQDYFTIKEQFNEYERARDRIDWIEDAQSGNEMRNRELRFLTDEEKELYGDLYGTDGFIRTDIQDVLLEERETEKDLLPIYTNDYLQEIREDFDIYMDKKYNKIARQATLENASAKVVQNDLQVKSLTEFGVNLDELQDFQPTNERGAILKDAILTSLKATKDVQQAAADTYQVAETYLDVKFDKNLRGELVDNWAGMSNEIRSGWFRGKAGDVILKLALGLEDVDDDYTTQQLAEEVVRYMEKSNTGKTSRAMSRWHSARGFREAFDAFIDNPAELALSLAGNSLSQMLPYGWKILGTATATGTATGAGIGMTGFVTGPGGVVTTAGGALTGFSWGLRSGFAATGYALEYTNAVLDGAKEYNYNILNPDEMKAAFQDERVWKFGRKRGAQRGIPIAIVDFLSAGLAGRIFQTGKTAALGTKIGLQVGERALFDPLAEGLGEYLAQKSAGQKIDWKEIFAEGLGGLGNNAPFMALNMALDMRASNNVDIANDLSTLKGLNRELKNYMISPTRVSNWANNMQRLGQITSEQNQRIQENLGIRKDALNILENPKALGLQSRTNRSVLSRTMELLAAKKDLESTTNRKEVFRNKIKDINIELAEIAETKTLRPTDQQTNLNIGGISGPQQTETDVRSDVTASYKIGDQTFNRPDFIKRIQNMTLEVFNDSNVQVENDKEVQDIINNKFKKDAIQEPKAENVDENQQAGVVSDLVTTVRKQADESQTFTEIAEVIDKPNKSDQTKFNNNKLEGERLDGILLGISERQDNKKPLTVLQKKIADKFKERLNEVVSLKTQLIEEKSKTIDNEAKDLENVLIEEGVVEKKETKVTEEQGIDRRQGVIEERDQIIQDTETEIKNVRSQLKKDLKKKNLSKEQKADLREEAKNLIDGYKDDIKEARREASKQLSLIQLEEGRKKKGEAKKVLKKTKAINDIDAEIEAIRKDKKRNRATKSVLIQELNQRKKNIQEGKVDFRTKERGATVNVAPFFDTSVESTTEAGNLRTSNEYEQYKQSLIDLGKDLGLEVEIEEAIGGYVNDAGTKIREISTVVNLKDATLEQASEFAAIAAALAPEVQESSIAAEYTTDGAINHNGDEITIKVSDTEGTFQALQEAGIDEFTLSETNNSLTLLDIFDFSDPQKDAKLEKLLDILDDKNITYEVSDKRAINSRYIGKESRQQILSDGRQGSLQQRQEGSSLREKILLAINRDAENEGITTEEYTEVKDTDTNMTTNDLIDKYVGMEDVGQFLEFLNKSFPFVTISVDQETFNKIISNPEVSTYVKNGQVIYGMTKDGQIFINSQVHNSKSDLFNTAIHEMGHVWIKNLLLSEKGKAIYKKGASLIKKTALYSKNLKKFDGDVNKAVEETMATLIGNKGESVVNTTLKQQIKNWISSLWEFVKSQFKLSKDLTVEEIQDLTLDQFLETAIADILSGKPVKIEDGKLSTLTKSMADVMFRVDDTITKIVESGRRNGFSDASIKKVLQGRGFLVSQINEAMEFDVDTTQPLPSEFLRIEGTENQSGIERAAKLFNDVNLQLQKFSMKLGQRVKTFSEIRQKAQQLLKAHPIFEAQPEQVQKELQVAFDRTLGYRSNKNIQREISEIKKSLNERKIGVDNLQRLKITMKNFIRQNLPPSKKYTQAKINRLISAITNLKRPEDAVATFEKVTKVIAEQRGVIKKDVLNKIYKIVSDKSSFRLQSKKRRPKGVDAVTQVVFNNIKEVLDAVRITNPEKRAEALKKISDYLLSNQQTIDEAAKKSLNNEELTLKEESLLQLQLAYDQYADLAEASLEQAQAVLTDVENLKAEGILKFNTRRLQKAEAAAKRTEEVTNQIKDTNPDLFRKDEDGNITDETKTREEIEQEIEDVREGFLKAGIMKVYNTVIKGIFGRGDLFQESYKNFITHMGTVTNFLDNKAKGLNVFTDKVYKKLNRASEVVLQNKRNMQRKLNDFAVQSGFKSLLDFEGQLNRKLGIKKDGRPNVKELTVNVIDKKTNQPTGRTKKVTLNANNLLRVYALSKNEIQKSKLENMGITADVLAEIENELGPKLISFADKIVDYFSTDYFNEINAVYKQANGINLGFIENYFPTKTERSKVDGKLLENGDFNGIFSSETAPAFKERTDNFSPILLKGAGFIDTMQNHVDTMETYKALAIPVQELNQFFQIPAVDLLLDVTGMKKLLKTLVNATVNPQSASSAAGVNVSGNFMQKIANKFTGFALAFKAIQILKQATSFVNAFSQYNYFAPDSKIPKAIRGPFELAMFMVDGAGVLMGIIPDLFGGNGVIAKARKMSATFDQRIAEGLEGDVYGLEAGSVTQKQVGQGVAGRMAKFRKGFKRLAASPTILGDILGVMGYYINYKRNIAKGMSEAQALEEFNDYNATQQSRRNTEKIPLQLQGDFASRAFTMFGSTLFLQINKVMQSTNNLKKSFLAGFEKDGNTLKKTARGTKQLLEDKQNIRDFYLNFAVANVLFTAVSNIALLTRGDDEDKDAFMRKITDAMMGLNLLYQIPLVGAAAETGINTFRGEGYKPVDDVVNPFTSIYKKIAREVRETSEADGTFAEKVLRGARPLVELYMGAQVDPFVGLINAIKDGVFGDVNQEEFYENIYDFLGITPSYRPGFGRRGSKVEGIIPQGGIRTKTDLKRYDPKLYEEIYGERDKLQKEIREERKKMLEEMGYKEIGGKLYPIN